MSNRPSGDFPQEPCAADSEVVPWTAAQANAWRSQNPSVSVAWVVGLQAVAAVVLSLLAWIVFGEASVAISVAYGGLSVVLPSALFARGLTSRTSKTGPTAAIVGFFLWEAVKVGLMLAMLLLAPKLIGGLSWPALLVGLIVVMKVYGLALVLKPRASGISKYRS